ncbi:RNA polymerase II-associated protein 1 [Eurosta solidaginis]|uniref:RNA polymerase II-associated protein 1 n=1 Tax=Eurosta solidaginis TaxID=178769 RepID=UPI003530B24A
MIKRPQSGETEEDILRMQNEFLSQRAKNPKLQPAAQCVKMEKEARKSLFVRNREKAGLSTEAVTQKLTNESAASITAEKEIMSEIHEIIGNIDANNLSDIVLGDIVERTYDSPMRDRHLIIEEVIGFPTVKKVPLIKSNKSGKSIFVSDEADPIKLNKATEDLSKMYGNKSVIVADAKISADVHKENLDILSKMHKDDILAEKDKLLNSIDPSLLALLKKIRQEKAACSNATMECRTAVTVSSEKSNVNEEAMDIDSDLITSKVALEILQQSEAEKWLHFDIVETDKLKWMQDIAEHMPNIKAGEQFEARFDWKGVLLPYSADTKSSKSAAYTVMTVKDEKSSHTDDRELYLHGDEPDRPGYTLQEMFRLARSSIIQQRISAFSAIGGILSIYNQGFYDGVLELPISKIFFLLRFGLDDNTPAMIEVVSKALACLLYNEADEILLDFIFENPGCHWQPILESVDIATDVKDITALENLQKHMQQLQMNDQSKRSVYRSDFEEADNEIKTSMSDFQLAETNLIECLMRTNILQRIYFILNDIQPENSTVSSCLKILIRIARTSTEFAGKIVSNNTLIHCLFEYFLPDLLNCATNLDVSKFYYCPQFLCLKLLRVLISQNLGIAVRLMNMKMAEMLVSYLSYRGDLKDAMIKVQIECLRIVRCLLLLRIDDALYSRLDSAFYYMLQWHYNYLKFEVGGPYLIRQHASALLMAISCEPSNAKSTPVSNEILNKCCCAWFYRATRSDITEFSQATLLSACVNVVNWKLQRDEEKPFNEFITKYLYDFLLSNTFSKCVTQLITSSVVLRKTGDRRCLHLPLPNVGAVLSHANGPQLIVPQTYTVYLLTTLWTHFELQNKENQHEVLKRLTEALMRPQVMDSLIQYLTLASNSLNAYLCGNFFSKIEVKFIFKLINCDSLLSRYNSSQILQLVYNYLSCLSAEHILEIEQLFDKIIFNAKYLNIPQATLNKWKEVFVSLVQSHYIVVEPSNLSLSKSAQAPPILSRDWPYFFFKIILQNYINNSLQKITADLSERDILQMTLTLVSELENSSSYLHIATPTEELMYAMSAFMGPESEFLTDDIRPLLRNHLMRLYTKYEDVMFDFDKASLGKCKFESLYSLFVDHFQATSYGDESFGSLVLVPMAQKYDSKWRRRMWSDYAPALCYLNCDESLLINGMQSYLEPVEKEESLIKAYALALRSRDVRPGTIPYKIAKYHVDNFKRLLNK